MTRMILFSAFALIVFSCSNRVNHSRKKFKNYWVESNFIDDTVFNGLTKFYNDKNILEQAEYYIHGVRNGISLGYHSNGKVYDSVNYANGHKNGFRFVYDSNGQLGHKEYYFMDHKMGPDIFFQGNEITRYHFTDFEKNYLYNYDSTSLDSPMRHKHHFFYWTPYQKYDVDSLNNYVFVYLIRPPKMSVSYELVARDSANKNESHVAYLTNEVFVDTLVCHSEDKHKFWIKVSVFDSLESGKQKLDYLELKYYY